MTVFTTFSTVKPKCLNSSRCRGGFAEAVHADHRAFQADIFVPEAGHTGFDRHALHALGQYAVLVGLILTVEHIGRRHRHHAHVDAFCGQCFLRIHRQLHFGTGGDDDGLRLAARSFGQHVATLADVGDLRRIALLECQVLAAENQ